MGLKLRSNFYLNSVCCTTFSSETVVISVFDVFLSGIQAIILDAFLFIDRFSTQVSHKNSNPDLLIPIGRSSFNGYFFNPKMSALVPQPVNSNAQRSTMDFGPQVVANKSLTLNL